MIFFDVLVHVVAELNILCKYNLLCVYLVVQNVSQKQIFIKEMLSLVYVVCESLPGLDPGHNSLFRGHYAQIGGGRGKGRFFRFQLTKIMEKILRTSKKTPKNSPKIPFRDMRKLSRILSLF